MIVSGENFATCNTAIFPFECRNYFSASSQNFHFRFYNKFSSFYFNGDGDVSFFSCSLPVLSNRGRAVALVNLYIKLIETRRIECPVTLEWGLRDEILQMPNGWDMRKILLFLRNDNDFDIYRRFHICKKMFQLCSDGKVAFRDSNIQFVIFWSENFSGRKMN